MKNTTVKEKYSEMRKRHQDEVNALPLNFAFGDEQWKKLLEKLGVKEDEVSEKLMNYGGAIILKSDRELVSSTFAKHHKELETAMQDMEFFKSALIYEMANHEYHINYQGDYDVLQSLGFNCKYESEMDCLTEEQRNIYKQARKEFLKQADENDWY